MPTRPIQFIYRGMSRYRRAKIEGGTFFFTLNLANRSDDLLTRHIDRLRHVYASVQKRRPFETVAICILPDHLHAIWSLPPGDADFATRWNLIKIAWMRQRMIRLPVVRSAPKPDGGLGQQWASGSRTSSRGVGVAAGLFLCRLSWRPL